MESKIGELMKLQADYKKKADEYQNSKNAGTASNVASAPAAQGGFTF